MVLLTMLLLLLLLLLLLPVPARACFTTTYIAELVGARELSPLL